MFPPTSEIVAITWLKTIPGLPSGQIATDLPGDESKWDEHGFVTVNDIAGTPDMYVPIAHPVLHIDCWAVTRGSNRPPWRKANVLAEYIRAATTNDSLLGVTALPAQFEDCRVMSAYMVSEPVPMNADEARFAVYGFDLAVHWCRHPKAA